MVTSNRTFWVNATRAERQRRILQWEQADSAIRMNKIEQFVHNSVYGI